MDNEVTSTAPTMYLHPLASLSTFARGHLVLSTPYLIVNVLFLYLFVLLKFKVDSGLNNVQIVPIITTTFPEEDKSAMYEGAPHLSKLLHDPHHSDPDRALTGEGNTSEDL